MSKTCLWHGDWLIERQDAIEKRLAKRHLKEGGLVLFDLTSSYFEGVTCPLAKTGYSRDGKKGTLQVNYGVLTDERGCPVSVSVFEGNTGDPKTLLPQVEKSRKNFGIDRLVMVGDRGMITNVQIDEMRKLDGIDWITALKSGAIVDLVDTGASCRRHASGMGSSICSTSAICSASRALIIPASSWLRAAIPLWRRVGRINARN